MYPSKPYHLNGRAKCKSSLGDYIEALSDLDQAIKILAARKKMPIDYEIFLRRAKLRYNKGMFTAALNDLNQAMRISPDSGACFLMRGLTNVKLGKQKAGCLDLSKAGELGVEEAYEYIRKICN